MRRSVSRNRFLSVRPTISESRTEERAKAPLSSTSKGVAAVLLVVVLAVLLTAAAAVCCCCLWSNEALERSAGEVIGSE